MTCDFMLILILYYYFYIYLLPISGGCVEAVERRREAKGAWLLIYTYMYLIIIIIRQEKTDKPARQTMQAGLGKWRKKT